MEKKRARELSDQDLEQAAGGMRGIAGSSSTGYYQCPKCKFKSNDKGAVYDKKPGSGFYCLKCGYEGDLADFYV